jgi:hypothetical protein
MASPPDLPPASFTTRPTALEKNRLRRVLANLFQIMRIDNWRARIAGANFLVRV